MTELTREELLAQNAALRLELSQRAAFEQRHVSAGLVPPTPTPASTPNPRSSSERTVVTETPEQATLTTVNLPPRQEQFTLAKARKTLAKRAAKTATPEEIADAITSLKTVIVSGVNSAGYGDKRTEFRSLSELRQILADLEEDLEEATGTGGRIRQIRMTTSWDKAL